MEDSERGELNVKDRSVSERACYTASKILPSVKLLSDESLRFFCIVNNHQFYLHVVSVLFGFRMRKSSVF